DRIEEDLMPVIPDASWKQFTHLLIAHGRAVCSARNPDCDDCEVEDLCPSSKLDNDVDLANDEPWDD
ncbi:MAG: endonuclease III, partial [Halobacteriales archaeon]|nr:endonuclease III [Halobacteriales archaeon]